MTILTKTQTVAELRAKENGMTFKKENHNENLLFQDLNENLLFQDLNENLSFQDLVAIQDQAKDKADNVFCSASRAEIFVRTWDKWYFPTFESFKNAGYEVVSSGGEFIVDFKDGSGIKSNGTSIYFISL
ncbi:hypothetical protein QJU11_09950 [Pasteurella atlantica]|uniref:hypothetical protein n=1 Tax=Phocoenobacter atlanticus TaxID=3416742 RepID=UPI00275AE156|nr:hypothetical protein [Pasteurella atlantica]MDP8042513.1 hypothetical protein [Pasteurella atlantica]